MINTRTRAPSGLLMLNPYEEEKKKVIVDVELVPTMDQL